VPVARILIDATPIAPRLKGTGRFLVGLLRALPEVAQNDEFVAVTWPGGADLLADFDLGVQVQTVPPGSETVWEIGRLGRVARRLRTDALLTLRELVGFGGPPTLLHLAEPPRLRLGQTGAPLKHRAKNRLVAAAMRGSLRRAAAVTASSISTAAWVEETTGQYPRVIPPGVDRFFFEADSRPWEGDPYLLHPATGDARDNTDLVLDAFAESDARRSGVRLVLTGSQSGDRELPAAVSQLGIADNVDVLGWVSDEQLRHLYANALALVHPTAFEGFAGLQPLEAMAQGAAVIVLEGPGVTEVLRGATEMISRAEVRLLAAAIDRLVMDDRRRRMLSEQGRRLADGFTWERSATALLEVLRSIGDR
jgi:glycosyltransferase involved in cell wall biosynthesis